MNLKQAINRTNNLLATVVVGVAGLAFAPEIFVEDELTHKIDDILLLLLGAGAVAWYLKGKNKYVRSLAPVVFTVTALLIKITAVVVEMKDKEDVGDDLGGLILFLTATIVIAYLYKTTKHLLKDVK